MTMHNHTKGLRMFYLHYSPKRFTYKQSGPRINLSAGWSDSDRFGGGVTRHWAIAKNLRYLLQEITPPYCDMEAFKEIELGHVLRVFEASLAQIKWRLKPSSKRHLQNDTLALCTGMRPVIMVDYGGKMPELGDRLCAFLKHCQQESSIFELLRVMIVDDMVYLIHIVELGEFAKSSLARRDSVLFVDLEIDPPKFVSETDENQALTAFNSAQNLFASVFDSPGLKTDSALGITTNSTLVDLSCCLKKCLVTIPTLNGWLLGYPVIYLFGMECIDRAVLNLSTKSLHIYRIMVERADASETGHKKEELMSFTVPYALSSEGDKERWAESFLTNMLERHVKCKHVWRSLCMEVVGTYPQTIAF